MDNSELVKYLREIKDYIEFSFYSDSSQIMNAISKSGFDRVFNVVSSNEVKKGVYECITTWEVEEGTCLQKTISVDITGEMTFLTEILASSKNSASTLKDTCDIDIQKEYGELLKVLKQKHLNSLEKNILLKVVKAFFE